MTALDEKAAEAVFQKYKHVKPRLNRAAIGLICSEYEAAKPSEQGISDSVTGAIELLHLAIYHKDPHSELLIRSKEILREIKLEGKI